jgi:hypothetical protein
LSLKQDRAFDREHGHTTNTHALPPLTHNSTTTHSALDRHGHAARGVGADTELRVHTQSAARAAATNQCGATVARCTRCTPGFAIAAAGLFFSHRAHQAGARRAAAGVSQEHVCGARRQASGEPAPCARRGRARQICASVVVVDESVGVGSSRRRQRCRQEGGE